METAIQIQQKRNGIALTSNSEELKLVIINLINAMRSDYKKQFTKDFKTLAGDSRQFDIDFNRRVETNIVVNKELLNYKCRLYSKLQNKCIDDIFAGYDLWVDDGNKFYPSIPELITSIKRVEKERLVIEKNKREIDERKSLPKPQKTSAIAMNMLHNAEINIKAKNPINDKGAWIERKKEAELQLNKLTASVPKKYAEYNQVCGYPGCNKSGSITSSTSGSNQFYCSQHVVLG